MASCLLCIKLNITKLRNSFHGTFPLLLGQYGTFLCTAALTPPAYSPFIIHTWPLTLLKRLKAHYTLAFIWKQSRRVSDLRINYSSVSLRIRHSALWCFHISSSVDVKSDFVNTSFVTKSAVAGAAIILFSVSFYTITFSAWKKFTLIKENPHEYLSTHYTQLRGRFLGMQLRFSLFAHRKYMTFVLMTKLNKNK